LLGLGEGHLPGSDPGTPVSDRRRFTAAHAAEEVAIGGSAELGEMISEQAR
jgi:hypothetical protein